MIRQRATGSPSAAVPIDRHDAGVVRADKLTKTYPNGSRPAVDSLSLEVHAGEFFGLLGPNGAGKSTTAGMLTTKIVPSSGSATICGIDVAARPTAVRNLIGVVSQANTLDRSLSVSDNLYFHALYFGYTPRHARRAAMASLEQFALLERKDDEIESLSGGMAQRLMIARALLHQPAVLFLDEPTANLDPQSRLAIWDILMALKDHGQTLVLSTHHMEEADFLCDRVAIVDHGKVLVLGEAQQLKDSLRIGADVVLKPDGDADAVTRRFAEVYGATAVVRVRDRVRVTLPERAGAFAAVNAVVTDCGQQVTEYSVDATSLESVFIHLTGRELRE